MHRSSGRRHREENSLVVSDDTMSISAGSQDCHFPGWDVIYLNGRQPFCKSSSKEWRSFELKITNSDGIPSWRGPLTCVANSLAKRCIAVMISVSAVNLLWTEVSNR
jgi:hypothetical protein